MANEIVRIQFKKSTGANNWKFVGDDEGTEGLPVTEKNSTAILASISALATALGSVGAGAQSLIAGRAVVSVTNTAIALGGDVECQTIFITALTTNTDVVVVGEGAIYTEASRTGKILYPGDTITVSIPNLNKAFINALANDGVSFAYLRLT